MDPAIDNLRTNQRQLDADGCEVGVSRQALDETLAILDGLLEALRAVRDELSGVDQWWGKLREAADAADAAIAKATAK